MGTDQQQHQRLNRRSFLQASAMFALMVGLGGKRGMLAASGLTPSRSIADLHFADFDALVGQSFRVYVTDSLPQVVQLAVVKNCAHSACRVASPRHEWFSLAFSGAKGEALPQGTHTFAHPRLGHFDLFVVPTMAVAHEERAIAIINRIHV
jgi:hypothetical protein